MTFADPALEAAVRTALGIPSGDLTNSAVLGVTVLSVNYAGVASASGIEHCLNLASFNAEGCSIQDVAPFAALPALTQLNLYNNPVTNAPALEPLTLLTSLALRLNSATDLSFLSGMTDLNGLSLRGAGVTALPSLAALDNLEYLGLVETSLVSLGFLDDIGQQLYSLVLDGTTGISDYSKLSLLTKTTELWLNSTGITNLTVLSSLSNLNLLSLNGNGLTGLTGLSSLTGLGSLSIENNNLTSLDELAGLTGLTSLDAFNNQISDISAIEAWSAISYLNLRINAITDIAPLLANLGIGDGDTLDLRSNPLSSQAKTDCLTLIARGASVSYDP